MQFSQYEVLDLFRLKVSPVAAATGRQSCRLLVQVIRGKLTLHERGFERLHRRLLWVDGLDHSRCVAEIVYLWFRVRHGFSPWLIYSIPRCLRRRNVFAGLAYALTGTARGRSGDEKLTGISSKPRVARSSSQYSSEIVQNNRTRGTIFPARASQIVFSRWAASTYPSFALREVS